jgi:bacillolysin
LDVVTHEFTHGVTEFTSDLIYQNESGALNEAFSDMLGNSSEFYAQTNGLDPAARPDWQIGEDVYLPQDVAPGFRNMADPAEDGDPDHYSELFTGKADNGGVHINSGIPNHAYYLLVNGGSNAGEARGHTHTGPRVRSIGLAKAEQIFYTGFTSLPANATMSQARQATEAAASARYGEGSRQETSTSNAWEAVGVR